MSYKWGLNGNDLNWDAVTCLNSFILELELAIMDGTAELDEDGNVSDSFYMGIQDSNPTVVYYPGNEVSFAEVKNSGKHLLDFVPWFLNHDTNTNFVQAVGEVPDEYYTEEYLKEKREAEVA